jgi:hypothetical protein
MRISRAARRHIRAAQLVYDASAVGKLYCIALIIIVVVRFTFVAICIICPVDHRAKEIPVSQTHSSEW